MSVPLLPGWLDPVFDAPQMRAIDSWAIESQGVPGLELMERAGQGVAQAVVEEALEGRVVVVCGKGNNGGDGLVVARLLHEQGHDVQVLLIAAASELAGDARTNLESAQAAGVAIGAYGDAAAGEPLARAGAVVDAIFGTGFSGALRGPAAEAIAAINACSAPVVAVDMPSGVDASTGTADGEAVNARRTVTFHAQKLGQWIMPGKALAGSVQDVPIGIPSGWGEHVAAAAGLVGPGVFAEVPRRSARSTKFSSGVLCVVGGSTGLTGAVCLASEAAMRAGAGYVRAIVPASLDPVFENRLLEVMTVPVADIDGSFAPDAAEQALAEFERAGAAVVGPGLGRSKSALAVARDLVARVELPLLVDADGLYALIDHLDLVRERPRPTVLTPHAGELARLLGVSSQEVAARRLEHLRRAVELTGAVVVLKGDDTLIAVPDGRLAVSRGGAPGLATAGSGDVLSGAIGAMLAKGIDAFGAACAGVYLHLEAARAASDRRGAEGLIASDVVEALPAALG